MFYYQTFFLLQICSLLDCLLQIPEKKKFGGHPARLREKENQFELSLREITFCTCTRSCARANDAKIVSSRDEQCNTKELPYNIHFLYLVQELGTVFLKVSEYSLSINLKFLYISSFNVFCNWRIPMLTHLLQLIGL